MEQGRKKALVVGLARSGIASAKNLVKRGFKVVATDLSPKENIKDLDGLEEMGIELVLQHHPLALLESCDLIVVSPGVPNDILLLKEARSRGIYTISELEFGYQLTKTPVIAITGTNGKTTTTTLLGEILKNGGKDVAIAGNIGMPLVEVVDEGFNKDYFIVEVSSFQLENIDRFRPKISVILNLSEDHLNRHGTFMNYVRSKREILKNQKDSDYVVLNYDDVLVRSFADKTQADAIFFSQESELAHGVYVKNNVIVISDHGKIHPILKVNELGIKGRHNLENALAAIAVVWLTRSNLNSLAESLRGFRGVEHRLEHVAIIEGVTYINDSKGTNPDAAKRALEAIEAPVVLIAGGYNKDSDFTSWILAFNEKVKSVVLLGETANTIKKMALENGFRNIQLAKTMEDAVFMASRVASKGDVVLLSPACASWDMFKSFEERGQKFKDSVLKLLQTKNT